MFSSSIELTHPFVIIKDCGYFTSACRECQRFARPMPGLMRDCAVFIELFRHVMYNVVIELE